MALCEGQLDSQLAHKIQTDREQTKQKDRRIAERSEQLPIDMTHPPMYMKSNNNAPLNLSMEFRTPHHPHFLPHQENLKHPDNLLMAVKSSRPSALQECSPPKKKRGRPRVDKTSPDYLARQAELRMMRMQKAAEEGIVKVKRQYRKRNSGDASNGTEPRVKRKYTRRQPKAAQAGAVEPRAGAAEPKKRGRKKKNALDEHGNAIQTNTEPSTKGKRGRKKKSDFHSMAAPSTNMLNANSNEYPTKFSSKTLKIRGRLLVDTNIMNEMVQCNFMKKKKLASANRAAELQSAIKNIPFESVTVERLRKQTPEVIGVHSNHILKILENANNAKEKHSKKKREDKVQTQEKSKTLNQEFNHERVMRQYTRLAIAAVESVLTWATTVVKVNAVSPANNDVQSLKLSKPIPNLPFEEKPPKAEILNAATLLGDLVAASETISSNHKMDEHGSIVIDSDDEPHSDFGSPGTESLSMDDNLRALRSLHEKYANIHLEKNSADQIRLLTAALDGRTHVNKVRNSATLTQSTEFKKSRTSLDSISISSKSSRSSRSSGSGSSDSGTDSGSDSESGSSSSDDDSASSDTMSAKSVNGDKSPASMPLDEFVPPTAAASTAAWGPTGSDRTEDDSASCTEEETPYSNACKRPHRKSRSTRTHSQKSTGLQTDTPAVCSDSSVQKSAQQEKYTPPRMPKIIYPTIKTICNDGVLMEESQLICVKDPCVKAGIEKILVKDNGLDVSIDETLKELSRGLDYIRHSMFPEPNECQNLGYVYQDDPEFCPVEYPSAGPEYGRTRSFEYSQPDYLDIVDKEISDDEFPPRRMPYLPYQSRTHSYTSEYIKNKNILAPADKSMVRPAHEDQPSPTPSSNFPPTLPVKVSKSILRHERKINVRKKIKFSSEIMEELRLRDEDNGGSLSESSSESAEKSFECDICHKWFSTLVTMKIHRRVHVLRPSGSSGSSSRGRRRVPERYECDCCDATFSRRERLMNHKAEAHRNAMTIRCDVCRRCFEDERELAAHAARHTADERAGRCADCGRVLPSWDELKRHRQAAHPTVMKSDRSRGDGSLSYRPGTNMSQRHLCRLCGKGFGHAHSLTRDDMKHVRWQDTRLLHW